jgi:hypothetical protein
MAATAPARRLTEAHRLAQARLGAQTIVAMRAAWSILDVDDLDGTTERWLTAARPIITAQRRQSALLAANSVRPFKALELGVGATAPIGLAEVAVAEAVTTSLVVTGPVTVKKAIARAVTPEQAMTLGSVRSSGAAQRHVLNGGRDTTMGTINADRQALGWARATSGKPCAFCAMLASRGPVYQDEGTAVFEPHEHCNCHPEPVYRRDTEWPAGTRQYADLWQQARDLDGDTTINFRRLIEGRA